MDGGSNMVSTNGFGWIGFYQELADKLFLFVDGRNSLVENSKA